MFAMKQSYGQFDLIPCVYLRPPPESQLRTAAKIANKH